MSKAKEMIQRFIEYAKSGKEFVVFDVETTGFSAAHDRILSFSAIKATYDLGANKFVETDRIDQYINPERPIPAKASEVNHITYERIKNEPTEKEASKIIAKFLGSCPFVIGQNVSFDIRMVEAMAKRCEFLFRPSGVVDTLVISKELIGTNTPNHELGTVAEYLGIQCDGLTLHESISDVIVTARILERFIARKHDILKKSVQKREHKPTPANKKPDSPQNSFTPTVTGMSLWERWHMKRIYVNIKECNVKIWYDLLTGEWNTKHDWDDIEQKLYGEVDIEYVKSVTAKMMQEPQYKKIRDAVEVARKESK